MVKYFKLYLFYFVIFIINVLAANYVYMSILGQKLILKYRKEEIFFHRLELEIIIYIQLAY